MILDDFFADDVVAAQLFNAVRRAVDDCGETTVRATKSQVAFRRRRAFAWVWIPGRYLRGPAAPLVLTVALKRHDESARWKEVVEPAPSRFSHHLELYDPADIDGKVRAWLCEAWRAAA